MDYKQFIQILKDDVPVQNSVGMLTEFVNEFPYFQTAHSLLAKEMYKQQHIRYEKQLKIASAYSADRKALYELIHPKTTNIFSTEPIVEHPHLVEETISENATADNIFETIQENNVVPAEEPVVENFIPPENNPVNQPPFGSAHGPSSDYAQEPPFDYAQGPSIDYAQEPSFVEEPPIHHEEKNPVTNFNEEIFDETEEEFLPDEELPPTDPHEIIRRRLNEILGFNQPETTEPEKESKTISVEQKPEISERIHSVSLDNSPEEDIISPPEYKEATIISTSEANTFEEQIPEVPEIKKEHSEKPKDLIEQIADESSKALDDIDKGELEYALEASLIQSLEKLPLIEKTKPKEEPVQPKANTFLDWLKIKSGAGFGQVEEVHAYEQKEEVTPIREESRSESNALIDRFIKEDPKIVVSKTEFYSPAIQAKKSITDNEDIVSETLAKIYQNQGNTLKARFMYEKLGLLYPEKKAYFAALISGIDKEINQQNKEDL